MKRTVSIASILLIMVICWVGGALAYTFTDTTDVQEWRLQRTLWKWRMERRDRRRQHV